MNQFKMNEDRGYPQKIFASQLITIEDLHQFRSYIVQDILTAMKISQQSPTKKWMKSHEVRRLLKISPGTLQNLKNTGVIPYTKIGGVHFFDHEDIQRVLESGKVHPMP